MVYLSLFLSLPPSLPPSLSLSLLISVDNVNPHTDHWNLKMLSLIVGSSLSALLALLLLLLAVRCFRKKSLRTTTTTELGNPSETSPLLGNKPRCMFTQPVIIVIYSDSMFHCMNVYSSLSRRSQFKPRTRTE